MLALPLICTGQLPPSFVEYALRDGAAGVLVASRREGGCAFRAGRAGPPSAWPASASPTCAPACRPNVLRSGRPTPANCRCCTPRWPRCAQTCWLRSMRRTRQTRRCIMDEASKVPVQPRRPGLGRAGRALWPVCAVHRRLLALAELPAPGARYGARQAQPGARRQAGE
ncbi:MAG: hydrogenase iron-sulfur subunit [Rubrivivax sp.]|nr:hydrogenase iron-sulfur subunit [Rubrivivax sp.]